MGKDLVVHTVSNMIKISLYELARLTGESKVAPSATTFGMPLLPIYHKILYR